MNRIPIIRRNLDGTVTDGTAHVDLRTDGTWHVTDFRDLDGWLMGLPPGASFDIDVDFDIDAEEQP